jgi:hypothetical protein
VEPLFRKSGTGVSPVIGWNEETGETPVPLSATRPAADLIKLGSFSNLIVLVVVLVLDFAATSRSSASRCR